MLRFNPGMLGVAAVGLIIANPAMAASLTAPTQANSTDYLLGAPAPLESFAIAMSPDGGIDGSRQSPLLTVGFSPAPSPPATQPSTGTRDPRQSPLLVPEDIVSPVPEPTTWALMILGFGIVGSALRTRRRSVRLPWNF